MKHYNVTAAILIHDNQILCMQRPRGKFDYMAFKYEFPGGKVEAGESLEAALSRELLEELELQINVKKTDYYMSVDYTYPDFSITLHSYMIEVMSRQFVMTEHVDFCWLSPDKLLTLDWAPADDPIVRRLMANL
jgi:8-oxo-dGTP diphosphatase